MTEIVKSRSDLMVKKLAEEIQTFHHHYHLLYDLRTLLGPELKIYCEIGVWQGCSSSLMLQHPYPTKVIGIDNFRFTQQYETAVKNVEMKNIHNREYVFHNADSQSPAFAAELEKAGHLVDILFIDGDHSAQGVQTDFATHAPFVRPGGFVVFDDYNDSLYSPHVKSTVDGIAAKEEVLKEFEVLGSLPNFLNVHPAYITEYNEFILRKK